MPLNALAFGFLVPLIIAGHTVPQQNCADAQGMGHPADRPRAAPSV
jgi:hypothetical protein